MENINIIKENIGFEQLFNDGEWENVVKGEYLIPDTHPDVYKVVAVDVKPVINNKETLNDKLLIEGEIQYDIIYLTKEEEGLGAHTVTYNDKFANYIDISGLEHSMICEAECNIEHIYANIINERKVGLEGILNIRYEIYNKDSIDVVKDIEADNHIEMKKKIETFDNMISEKQIDMLGKETITLGSEKSEIDNIIKCVGLLHKKDVRLSDGKIACSCFVKFNIVYRGKGSKDLYSIEEDIFISKEQDMDVIDSEMTVLDDFNLVEVRCTLEEDDLGEKRVINLEGAVQVKLKIYDKLTVEILDDAYMTDALIDVKRADINLSYLLGFTKLESIVKDSLYMPDKDSSPVEIINCKGKVEILEKKIENGKIKVDGFVKVEVIYRSEKDDYLNRINGEIPFNVSIDADDINSKVKAVIKSSIDSIQASIEANTIAIKAVVNTAAKVWKEEKKNCVIDIEELEGDIPNKKYSVTIYTVQPGDTLWDLAKRYNTTVADIEKVNDIEEEKGMEFGMKLIIPGKALIA